MGAGEFSYRISISTLRVVFPLLFVLRLAKGQFRLFGAYHPVKAAPGDDVILPCHVEPKLNVAGMTVEWSRPDRCPDPKNCLSHDEYVHLYRHNSEVTEMKLPSYIGRTALFTDSLREGNISLRITNVTQEDEGRYRCFIPKLKSHLQSSVVHLIVDPSLTETGTTETPLQPENLHIPDLNGKMNIKGGSSERCRLIPVVVLCMFILLCIAVRGCLMTESLCQKAELKKLTI
ncbi:myelin-oligodendrocyte glycoprotein-like isoform X1 [Oreochromis niloticus]|uniref:Myelin-oligodendrocyte glycoprotein-like n=1 Tax=Oreochromis niloticus TaxID=8128 RepID=A0A669EG17_ORENI|nr:myelin-oligodendrocyte glycoprotein-like isoform X1 [Oreochromis niloticus]